MRIDSDQWGEIMDSLTRNKARTFLTAFGIFWGVFMLMVLMGGGTGLQEMLAHNFAGFATNSGFIFVDNTSEPYAGFQSNRVWSLEMEDLRRIKERVPEVDVVAPSLMVGNANATFRDEQSSVFIKSFTEDYGVIESVPVSMGRSLNASDEKMCRKVCVIGRRNAEELFKDTISPLGQFIEISGVQYQVVGVNSKESNSIAIGDNVESTVYIPYATLSLVYNRANQVDFLGFTVKGSYKVSEVQEKVAAVIKRAHRIAPYDTKAVQMLNFEAMFGLVENLFKGISILVWMIGLGTLLASAIGVSNIMLVTVRERTSEIGIRRAIGATPKDIIVQTMSESIVLTLTAGLFGICLSVLCLSLIENSVPATFAGSNFQVPFWTAVGAAVLLSMLGVLAGIGPTARAMSIKPVDAMREE